MVGALMLDGGLLMIERCWMIVGGGRLTIDGWWWMVGG